MNHLSVADLMAPQSQCALPLWAQDSTNLLFFHLPSRLLEYANLLTYLSMAKSSLSLLPLLCSFGWLHQTDHHMREPEHVKLDVPDSAIKQDKEINGI